jgi:hypothetical protein
VFWHSLGLSKNLCDSGSDRRPSVSLLSVASPQELRLSLAGRCFKAGFTPFIRSCYSRCQGNSPFQLGYFATSLGPSSYEKSVRVPNLGEEAWEWENNCQEYKNKPGRFGPASRVQQQASAPKGAEGRRRTTKTPTAPTVLLAGLRGSSQLGNKTIPSIPLLENGARSLGPCATPTDPPGPGSLGFWKPPAARPALHQSPVRTPPVPGWCLRLSARLVLHLTVPHRTITRLRAP